jgi:hypothetical protein
MARGDVCSECTIYALYVQHLKEVAYKDWRLDKIDNLYQNILFTSMDFLWGSTDGNARQKSHATTFQGA